MSWVRIPDATLSVCYVGFDEFLPLRLRGTGVESGTNIFYDQATPFVTSSLYAMLVSTQSSNAILHQGHPSPPLLEWS